MRPTPRYVPEAGFRDSNQPWVAQPFVLQPMHDEIVRGLSIDCSDRGQVGKTVQCGRQVLNTLGVFERTNVGLGRLFTNAPTSVLYR